MATNIYQQFIPQHTAPKILCCMCGVQIDSNPSNMCINCIRSQVDISEGIPKQLVSYFCRTCGRYQQHDGTFIFCELESKELMAVLLSKLKTTLKHRAARLIDCAFVWTEPHSRRIKLRLTIQKEVPALNQTLLQQVFVVEFSIKNNMCPLCIAQQTDINTWNTVVQLRQKVNHKRTFLYLEQLILKHKMDQNTLFIKEETDGLDFYFGLKNQAAKFVDFLRAVTPVRYTTSKRLISQDDKSNTFNYKHTYSIEMPPICKDDLVCLPSKLASSLANINPLVICLRVASLIHVIDPQTLKTAEINSNDYWRFPFRSIGNSAQLVEFTIMDIEPIHSAEETSALVEVTVIRSAELGITNNLLTGKTHLGYLLKIGDTALGFDLLNMNFNDDDILSLRNKDLPSFILVRKNYATKKNKARKRKWKLQALTKEQADSRKNVGKEQQDYEEFLQELERDPEMRSKINLYKKEAGAEDGMTDGETNDDDEEHPDIGLEELIEDLNLNDDDKLDAKQDTEDDANMDAQ